MYNKGDFDMKLRVIKGFILDIFFIIRVIDCIFYKYI